MTFFDQPFYALTKAHVSRIGLWPEQSKYVRLIRLLTMFAMLISIAGPVFIRLPNALRDVHSFLHDLPTLMIGIAIIIIVLISIQHSEKIKLSCKNIEGHWEMLKNTSGVTVLVKYTERGRFFIAVYSNYLYIVVTLWLMLYLTPTILDFIHPLNETRPKTYIFINVEYGVDVDEYYWFVIVHQYIVAIVVIRVLIAVETMYILWTVHACALFEVVGFADLIESITFGIFGATILSITSIIVFTSVQALVNLNHPAVLIQLAAYTSGQIIHLYINIIPGQELINHSQQIHTIVYNMDWQGMSVEARKLLIPIMIRSNRLCRLTAGKVYVLSMESFGSTIRTVLSYLTVFAQLI